MTGPGRTAQGLGPHLRGGLPASRDGSESPREAGLGGPWQNGARLRGEQVLRRFLRQQQAQRFPEVPGVSAQAWACPARPAPPLRSVAVSTLLATPLRRGTCQQPAQARDRWLPHWVPASCRLDGERPGPAGGWQEAPCHRSHVWATAGGRNPIISLQKSVDEGGRRQIPGTLPRAFAGGLYRLRNKHPGPGSGTPGAQMERCPRPSRGHLRPHVNPSPLSFFSNFVSTARSWRQSRWCHPPRATARFPESTWPARPSARPSATRGVAGPWITVGTRPHAPLCAGSAVASSLRSPCPALPWSTPGGELVVGGAVSSRTSRGEAAPLSPRSAEPGGHGDSPCWASSCHFPWAATKIVPVRLSRPTQIGLVLCLCHSLLPPAQGA